MVGRKSGERYRRRVYPILLLVVVGAIMASVAPSLPTADAVVAIVFLGVLVVGFATWLWFGGGGGLGKCGAGADGGDSGRWG
jgi:hypothetical protein